MTMWIDHFLLHTTYLLPPHSSPSHGDASPSPVPAPVPALSSPSSLLDDDKRIVLQALFLQVLKRFIPDKYPDIVSILTSYPELRCRYA